jgi:hypothetical protein
MTSLFLNCMELLWLVKGLNAPGLDTVSYYNAVPYSLHLCTDSYQPFLLPERLFHIKI